MKTKLHFARFEFKYILPDALRKDVEAELKFFLDFDPFVQNSEDHKYFVRSLYFDDPHYTAFYDKVEGIRSRSKFRIRTYTNDPSIDAPLFLEIKGRHNNLVYKHRTPLPRDLVEAGSKDDKLVEQVTRHAEAGPIKSEFEYQLYRRQLKAAALIDYDRRPYISKYDPEFRLTFDENLHATQTTGLFPGATDRRRPMLPGHTVMEVKFKYHMPSWFHRVIQSYELQRVSISKICRGMEALGMAEDL